ncbi:MAG: Hpt domain-containing protein [Candidatus Omnitrophota bacterium]|nr:Hpt domain-containing protein [Candidatus Omnitrophota bacterium]MDZ4242280.1 Hpt domain-containing protein [Candidatus Omnitrophota bacterium]
MSDTQPSQSRLNLDIRQSSAALQISEEIYLRILGKAVEQTTRDLSDLATAIAADDYEKIRAIGHRLKGDYDNMRITALSSVARQMNEIAKTSKDKTALQGCLTDLQTLFNELKGQVNPA